VRQRQEERRWEMRGVEDEVCFLSFFSPLHLSVYGFGGYADVRYGYSSSNLSGGASTARGYGPKRPRWLSTSGRWTRMSWRGRRRSFIRCWWGMTKKMWMP
jgi:hypothetical protein